MLVFNINLLHLLHKVQELDRRHPKSLDCLSSLLPAITPMNRNKQIACLIQTVPFSLPKVIPYPKQVQIKVVSAKSFGIVKWLKIDFHSETSSAAH